MRGARWCWVWLAVAGCGADEVASSTDLQAALDLRTADDLAIAADLSMSPDALPALAPEMVRVAGGLFRRGCNDLVDSECFADERPGHVIELDAFDLDRFPATARDYRDCVDAGRCTAPSAEWDPVGAPDLPVNYISWQQAVDYCAFRGKRLPTEAEWERAARGDDWRKYPWGDAPPPDCGRVNASPCGRRGREPVGAHPENVSPYGARDMAGNLWQWVSDWYDAGYYTVSPRKDPRGPEATMGLKAKRGGAFSFDFAHLRTSTRYAHNPLAPDNDIGVRCARGL